MPKTGTSEEVKQYHRKYQESYFPKHYEQKKDYYKEKARKRKEEIRQWIEEYKATLKCARCSENHPACMQFHHTIPSEKDIAICECANKGWSQERILKEIAKCEVLCANCHAKHHWEEKQGVV